jgi:XTP/dITP diphosphohydrolase
MFWEECKEIRVKRQYVLLASNNAGKVAELSTLLSGSGLEVLGLEAFPEIGKIEENGLSFEENALIKARHAAARSGLPSLADDSGLAVDALDGAPGVRSARYADDLTPLPGENRDGRNIRKLLQAMDGFPEHLRACRFICCMAAVSPNGEELLVRGEWQGRLLTAPRGSNGFGYDPIFFDPALNKAAAELSGVEKNAVSHRGRALRALLEKFGNFLEKTQTGTTS